MKTIRTDIIYKTNCPACGESLHTKNNPIMNRDVNCPFCLFEGVQDFSKYQGLKTVALACSLCGGDLTSIAPDGTSNWRYMYCKRCGGKC